LEKDIEPLVETAAWNLEKRLSRSTPERHANLHGILDTRDRRLIQDIAFRYRGRVAAKHRGELANVNGATAGSAEKLNVFAEISLFQGV
jgi:hypothetical protein